MNLITIICVFLPFISAILTYFIGKKSDAIRNTLTIASCFLVLATITYGFFSVRVFLALCVLLSFIFCR